MITSSSPTLLSVGAAPSVWFQVPALFEKVHFSILPSASSLNSGGLGIQLPLPSVYSIPSVMLESEPASVSDCFPVIPLKVKKVYHNVAIINILRY